MIKVDLATNQKTVIDVDLLGSSLLESQGRLYYYSLLDSPNPGLKQYDPSTNQITTLIPDGSISWSYFFPTAVINNKVYFIASSNDIGVEWHYYDLITNTVTGLDFNPNGDSYPYQPKVLGGRIYYTTQDPDHQGKLAVLNPQNNQISVIDHLPGEDGDFYDLTEANGKIYFTANMDSNDWFYTMYEYDPSTNQLNQRSQGLMPENWVSYPYSYFGYNGKVYFIDNNDDVNYDNWELYVYDPVTQSSQMVVDYNPDGSSNPLGYYAVTNGKIYFTADDGQTGQEPVVFDPNTNQISLLLDYTPGPDHTYVSEIFTAGNDFYLLKSSNPNPKIIKVNTLNNQSEDISLPHLYTIESPVNGAKYLYEF